ncbi:MAG TPA: protein-L-isoaspartate(D-aspartate) O-methyltransferase [Candidatus Margulisiibacteriota bacterium]|nr:protein-L-isoaspartate(D-aspartate) O-methyltransferase [Candidatus Margulisiibacteriota bacterium]
MNFEILRKRMVEEQLIPRGINNPKLLQAFYKVERHKFMPEEMRDTSYADYPVPIGEGQTISQPFIVALMTESLGLTGNEKVLEIGTGSGYQTAILAELAKEVYTIERFERLSRDAEEALKRAGYNNVKFKIGDGTLGWIEEAPFDRIIITAASPRIPLPLGEQLKEGARLVLPLGESFSQVLTVAEKKKGKLESAPVCGCVFVPLIGKYGWKNEGGEH